MRSPYNRPLLQQWLSTTAAIVCLVAQVALVLGPIGEARWGGNFRAHVEAAGAASHYAHNEASCAVCQARTTPATVGNATEPLTDVASRSVPLAAYGDTYVALGSGAYTLSRAPPTL